MHEPSRRAILKATVLPPSWRIARAADRGEFQLFWGDLHNHNAVGYARGSLERTYDIAREHLDFLAFTPHAQWHDMPAMEGNAQEKWAQGFKVLAAKWEDVARVGAARHPKGTGGSLARHQ